MAGRGRPTTSLTHEQMSSLGLMGKDLSQAITTPPPIFPTLMSKPVPLEAGAARDYKILWKDDFISFLKDSPYFTHPTVDSGDTKVQRYSDKYVNALSSKRDQLGGDFAWNRLPAELRPNWKRKSTAAANGSKRAKQMRASAADGRTVEEKLKALEEKENGTAAKASAGGGGGAAGGDATDARKRDSDEEDDEEVGQDEQDEEMDDENDYGNSYFDNGDAYNEEDDNLDDGPVY